MVHVRRGRDLTRRRAIEPLLRKDRKRRAENQLTRLVVRAGGSNPRFERAVPRCSPFCAPLRSCRASNRGAGRSSPLNKHEGDSTLYAMHCTAIQLNPGREGLDLENTGPVYDVKGLSGSCVLQNLMAVRTRLELATSGVTGQCSNQLNYRTASVPARQFLANSEPSR